MEQILTRLAPVVSMHKSLLFSERTIVHTDRHRECRECGCLAQLHECPFAPGMKPTSGRPNMNGTSASASAVGSLAAGRPPSRVPQADDHMCKSWRQKTCPRKEKNLPCAFAHPGDHVPKPNVCFEFTRTGHCSRGTLCRFQHGAASSTPASDPPAVSAPAAPAAAAPLPGASAAAPAAARPLRSLSLSGLRHQSPMLQPLHSTRRHRPRTRSDLVLRSHRPLRISPPST
jgi:hypothetical protein